MYYEELSEKVTRDKNTTPREIPKIQVPHRSNFFKVVNSEVKINTVRTKNQTPQKIENFRIDKQKFKDKVELKEMVRVRTVKRFF